MTTELFTSIRSITLYPDRAWVTRQGGIELGPGLHQLEVTLLPRDLQGESLRAAARGTARARLLNVQARRTFFADTPSSQVQDLEKKVESLRDEINLLGKKTDLFITYRSLMDALLGHTDIYVQALAAGELTLEAEFDLFDGLNRRAEKLDEMLATLAITRREKERLLEKLTHELEQLRSSRPRERTSAVIEIEVQEAGTLTVELSYVITQAGWKPLYDIRLIETADQFTLEVSYLAQITQSTGEDWQNIALTLSTARPALAAKVPELDPWYIQPRPTMPPLPQARAVTAAPRLLKAAAAEEDVTAAAPVQEFFADFAQASVGTTPSAVTYKIAGSVSIPPDGTTHKVAVANISLPPNLDYITAPKLVEAVYRRVKTSNASPYTLLPGAANLFAGDEFIGITSLELTAPQGEMEFYLGVDDRITVKRELKRREVDKRMLGNRRRLVYGYEITLDNLLPALVKIALQDQIPVSRSEEIRVKVESAEPPAKEQTELNLLNWEIELPAGEKTVVRFDFSIEYPTGMEVNGLP